MNPEIATIMYPVEYFSAMVHWSLKISRIKDISLQEAMLNYSDLYGSLTEEPWDNRLTSELWKNFISQIEGMSKPEQIINYVYDLYLQQDHSAYADKIVLVEDLQILEDRVIYGPLVLAYDTYNRERDCARIHYNPTRSEKSWLASAMFEKLEIAFKTLLEYSKKHYLANNFTSATWLNNVPNFRRLFPDSFNEKMVDIGPGSFLGLWGQFVQSNGYGNAERLNEFLLKLNQASTYEESIKAIPLIVLEGVGPVSEFYKKYKL